VLKAVVAVRPKYPQTLHYSGDGVFFLRAKALTGAAI
jgi:hypothetical protein